MSNETEVETSTQVEQPTLFYGPRVQDPRSRPFTQLAARMIGGHNALSAGCCPTCSREIGEFRDALSKKEFSISGMCQSCQDSVFGVTEGKCLPRDPTRSLHRDPTHVANDESSGGHQNAA